MARLNFSKKYLFTFMFFVMVTISLSCIAGYHFYSVSFRNAIQTTANDMTVINKYTANNIREYLHNVSVRMEAAANSVEAEKSGESFVNFLKLELKINPSIHILFRMDKNGNIEGIAPEAMNSRINFKDEDFFADAFAKKETSILPFSSGILTGGGQRNDSVLIAIPKYNQKGAPVSFFGAVILTDTIGKEYVYKIDAGHSYIWIADSEANVVIDPDSSSIGLNLKQFNTKGEIDDLIANLTAHSAGEFLYNKLGEMKIGVATPMTLGHLRWNVIYTSSYEEVRELVYPIFFKLVIMMLVVSAVILTAGGLLTLKMGEVSRLKEKIVELEVQIDEEKKHKEVTEIVESEYFQDLASRIDELKNG